MLLDLPQRPRTWLLQIHPHKSFAKLREIQVEGQTSPSGCCRFASAEKASLERLRSRPPSSRITGVVTCASRVPGSSTMTMRQLLRSLPWQLYWFRDTQRWRPLRLRKQGEFFRLSTCRATMRVAGAPSSWLGAANLSQRMALVGLPTLWLPQ